MQWSETRPSVLKVQEKERERERAEAPLPQSKQISQKGCLEE